MFSLQYQCKNQAGDKKKEKEKDQFGDYYLIENQILQTNTILIMLQTVRRKSNEILGVKGFKRHKMGNFHS